MSLKRTPRAARKVSIACLECGYVVNVPRESCPLCRATLPAGSDKAERAKRKEHEERHQIALFDWVKLAKGAHPDLGKLYHVPNGGARSKAEAARLKAAGVRAGVLDLALDVARGGYFGLRIELKATKAELGRAPTVSPEQSERIATLQADGYAACVCEGWEAAQAVLLEYVGWPRTEVVR